MRHRDAHALAPERREQLVEQRLVRPRNRDRFDDRLLGSCRPRTDPARRPRRRLVAEQPRRNQAPCRNRRRAVARAHELFNVDICNEPPSQRLVRERSPVRVHHDEIGRQLWTLEQVRAKVRILAQRLDVGGRQVPCQRVPARSIAVEDIALRQTELVHDAVGARQTRAPVLRMRFLVDPATRLESHNAKRSGARTRLLPRAFDPRRSLGDDRERRVRQDRRQDRERSIELDRQFVVRDHSNSFDARR